MTDALVSIPADVPHAVADAIRSAVAHHRHLADALRSGAVHRALRAPVLTVPQDEFSHDVVFAWDAAHFVVYEVT